MRMCAACSVVSMSSGAHAVRNTAHRGNAIEIVRRRQLMCHGFLKALRWHSNAPRIDRHDGKQRHSSRASLRGREDGMAFERTMRRLERALHVKPWGMQLKEY